MGRDMARHATCEPAGVRHLVPLACVAVLAVAACGGGGGDERVPSAGERASTTTTRAATAGGSAGDGGPDLLAGWTPAAIDWEDCGDGTECGTLAVPLDWDDPTGETIDLALARVPAEDADERVGVLVTNPGGPGASGVDFVLGGGVFAGTELAERFDVVSWDPRGVGRSAGLDCAEDEAPAFWAVDSDPDDAREQALLDDAARAVAEACGAEAGRRLPHVGTDDTAYDLEAIRRALDAPMAYYGFSYGTLIGLRYAELFPSGASAIVLDGVVDPAQTLTELLRAQAVAFEAVVDEMLEGVEADWDAVAAAAERAPIPADGPRGLTPADLRTATTLAAYSESYWPLFRDAVEEAADGDATALLALADEYWAVADFAAYQAISCLDSEHPVGAEAWAAFAAELEAVSPRLGASFANEMLPCAFWPVPPDPVTGPVDAEGAPPILVIGTTEDPATPLGQAEQVAAALDDGHLLVHEGEGHTAFAASECVRDAVAAYLIDGDLPAPGTRC
jgi:pimeloyl-ACP methyl ester carboxylesterase